MVSTHSIPLSDDDGFDFYVLSHFRENIEKLAAKEEQPQEESSDSETTVFDNMPPKNFLEIVATRKCQKVGELAFASQTASGSTTSDQLQQSLIVVVDDANPFSATAIAGSFVPLTSK